MKKYEQLATFIIENLGGKENVASVTHCMTRLRFEIKDESKINEEELKNNTSIISTAHAAGKFQVIIGNSVSDVYDEVIQQLGLKQGNQSESNQKENFVTKVTNVIVKVITPTLGCLVAAGLLKGLLAILVACQAITPTSGTYAILNAVGDSIFYFFPVILGYTSAETFGLNKFIGMVLGGTLLYPALFTALTSGDPILTIFPNTAFQNVAYGSFFGIPVLFPATGYASTVIPIVLICLFASKVEKWLKSKIPDIVGFAFVPFLTLLIAAPVGLIVIGPVSNLLQSLISWCTEGLLNISPVLAALVISLVYQPLVIFGLHWPLITIAITNFQTLGYDYLWPMMFTASFAQTAVVMAVAMKTKNKQTKATAVPAIISGLMCIIEPAIYGFSLKDNKRFAFSMIGAAAGGVLITILHAVQYTLGIGLLGFSGFINPANGDTHNMIVAIIGVLVTMVVTFILTYVFFDDVDMKDESKQTSKTGSSDESLDILSPVKGTIVPIEEVEDNTFASEVIGKSVAIIPESNEFVSPCDGIVEALFPTGHAIGLIKDNGESILIHIGIDTVNLNGECFTKHVHQGDIVKKGDLLITADIKKIVEKGYNPVTIVTLSNSSDYHEIGKVTDQHVDQLSKIMVVE